MTSLFQLRETSMTAPIQLTPDDEFNQSLVRQVHPPDWCNPTPKGRYNLVVIGAGTAGLVAAAGAAGLGAKVALIERNLMGGDCLNTGCVPSKAILRSAKAMHAIMNSADLGIQLRPAAASIDFGQVMRRMRKLRSQISQHDSAQRFRELGVDVFLGTGRFLDHQTLEVGEQKVTFKKAVIATGARAAVPEIPGIAETGFLTNESVFSLTELPARLAVIGGGPIGCELAQAFARFGSQVTLVHSHSQILPREDSDAAEIIRQKLETEGVNLLLNATTTGSIRGEQGKQLTIDSDGKTVDLQVDEILVAAGRAPNVQGLDLEHAGIEYNSHTGIFVNDYLQTTNPQIYGAGDICSHYQFTHSADFQARTVIGNALFPGRSKASRLLIPWCTYTDPEIAHVGLYEHQAREKKLSVQTFQQKLESVDRAILDNETSGFVKIHVKQGTDRILGATIVATHAGDLISEITLAMQAGIGLKKLASVIHPYPTQADAIRKIGDQYNRTRLTPFLRSILSRWLKWTL